MPIQSEDSPSTGPIKRPEYKKATQASFRYTYSPTNAMQFKDTFDKMIVHSMDQRIDCSTSGYKAGSLYIKAQDALRWLADNSPTEEERNKYSLLRAHVSIKRGEDYILIYFRRSIARIIETATNSVVLGKEWKDNIIKWLETAQDGEMFERDNVMLEEEDRAWLTALVAGLTGTPEMEIVGNKVRIMR